MTTKLIRGGYFTTSALEDILNDRARVGTHIGFGSVAETQLLPLRDRGPGWVGHEGGGVTMGGE